MPRPWRRDRVRADDSRVGHGLSWVAPFDAWRAPRGCCAVGWVVGCCDCRQVCCARARGTKSRQQPPGRDRWAAGRRAQLLAPRARRRGAVSDGNHRPSMISSGGATARSRGGFDDGPRRLASSTSLPRRRGAHQRAARSAHQSEPNDVAWRRRTRQKTRSRRPSAPPPPHPLRRRPSPSASLARASCVCPLPSSTSAGEPSSIAREPSDGKRVPSTSVSLVPAGCPPSTVALPRRLPRAIGRAELRERRQKAVAPRRASARKRERVAVMPRRRLGKSNSFLKEFLLDWAAADAHVPTTRRSQPERSTSHHVCGRRHRSSRGAPGALRGRASLRRFLRMPPTPRSAPPLA